MRRGDSYFAKSNYYSAIIEYRVAVQLDATSGEARKKLGSAYLRVNDSQHALQEYVRAADLLPDDLDVQLTAGRLLHLAGQFEEAKSRARMVLQKDPRNVEAVILLGSTLLGMKDVDSAIGELEDAIRLDPHQSSIYTTLGAFELSKGRTEQAEAAFRQAVELEPDAPRVHVALGYYLWAARRIPEAEAAFKRALELDPKSVLVNRLLATLLLTTNRVAAAEPYLKTLALTGPAGRFSLIDYYLASGRFKDATDVIGLFIAEGVVSVQVKLRLAAIRLSEGRMPDATTLIDEVLLEEPDNAAALLAKAQILLADNRPVDALLRVEQAAEADPKNAAVQYTLGRLYASRNEYREAIAAFNEALKINPRAVAAQEQLARLYLIAGDPRNAVHAATEALNAQSENGDLRLLLARGLLAVGESARAESEAQVLLKQYPASAAVHALMGSIYQSRDNTVEARRAFERALELDRNDREALTDLVALEVQSHHSDRALDLVEERLAKNPRDPQLLELAARARATAGDLRSAEQLLKRLIAEDSSNLSAYGMLGQLYMSQQRLEEARLEYERGLAENPNSIALQTIVAMILEAQNKTDEAQRRYERILEMDSGAVVASNNLAWIYVERSQKLDFALQLAQRAKQRLPADPRVNDTLGWIYFKKNLTGQAIPLLEEGVKGDSTNALHLHHLGMAYYQAGDWVKARQTLERALKLTTWFPGIEDARRVLAITGT